MFCRKKTILAKQGVLFLVSTVSIFLLLYLSCLSCQSKPSDSTPKWSADGIINDREYINTASYSDELYNLYWDNDEQYIYMGMKVKTNGYVAVGFTKGGMINSDVIFGFVKNGEAFVYDVYVYSYQGYHPEDIESGGTNDLLQFGGKEEGEYTIIEFKRKLNTGDRYDIEIMRGKENSIIWSYGNTDSMTFQHVQRGYGQIKIN